MGYKKIFSEFDLQDIELQVCITLMEIGEVNATSLARRTHISRTAVYGVLERLKAKGLIKEKNTLSARLYQLEDTDKISYLLDQKLENISSAKSELKILDASRKRSIFHEPEIQYARSREDLQLLMSDMLFYKEKSLHAVWPIVNVMEILGKKYWEEFQTKRIERSVSLKVVWPHESKKEIKNIDFLKSDTAQLRQVRISPSSVKYDLGYVVYGNKTIYISSGKEHFGFLVKSPELADLMRMQFSLLWDKSVDL